MQQDVMEPFGEVLKTYRKQKRLSQQQLAQKLAVHMNTISAWERGEYLPKTRGMILEIANQLSLDRQATSHLLETSLTLSSTYWQVPYQRNPFFTGRTEFLQKLHEQLSAQQAVALSQSYALSGLGGIGKTQLAVEYAYQHASDYRAVFWIAAETIDTINASFTAVAEMMQLPEHKEKDHQKIVKAVLHWLTTHKNWLLIFDNVEAVSLIKPFLPTVRQGAILITTHLHALDNLAYTLELPPLSSEEGIQFLLRRARPGDTLSSSEKLSDEMATAAKMLVEMMDGLPLALDQAGAYIERTGCSLTDYLHIYQSHEIQLLNNRSEAADHPHSVVKTILFSFEKLAQVNAAAADLLRICAFLAPEAIPEELFTRGNAHLGPLLGAATTDAYQFNLILGEALQYSLLYRQAQDHTLSLHRLVQAVLKATMDEAESRLWASRAAAVVATSVSHTQEQHAGEQDDRYLSHTHAVIQHIQQWSDWREEAALIPLWYYIGLVAEQYSQLIEARDSYLQGAESAYYHHHPLEAPLLAHLGVMVSDLGDDQQGLNYLEQSIALARQLHDEGTLCLTLLDQGRIHDNLGNYKLAETLYQEGASLALRIHDWAMASTFLKVLGVQAIRRGDYEQTALHYHEGLAYARLCNQPARESAFLMNIGMLAIHRQQYDRALTYTLESLALAQQVGDRFRISSVSQNLGTIYRILGQPEQAQRYLDDSLRLAREIQHPWLIAETQGVYGWLLLKQKQYSEAHDMFQHMLKGAQNIQAPQLMAHALFALANIAVLQNSLEQAQSLAQDSLGLFTQLGDSQRERVAQWLDAFPSPPCEPLIL